jgi:pSer/pThr/pTyr-binding forkhead associated (FHA) protein
VEKVKMSGLLESRLVIINTENDADGIIFVPSGDTIKVGRNLDCDIRINYNGIEPVHFEIFYDSEVGKVRERNRVACCILLTFCCCTQIKVKNFSEEHQIQVNGVEVPHKKVLNSGDIISLMGSRMRWESKAEARRELNRGDVRECSLNF